MGVIFAKDKCDICEQDNKDYNNPIMTFNHIGKYHGKSLCVSCFVSRVVLKDNYLYPIIEIKI